MRYGSEPVIAVMGGVTPAALADVLIAAADGQPPGQRCAELHAQYPGLTIALLVYKDHLVAGYRDGTTVTVAATSNQAVPVAHRLYQAWVLNRNPAHPGGRAPDRHGSIPPQ